MPRSTIAPLLALSLFALGALTAREAGAVTASVCLRNDGVGTFAGSDLALFANSD